MNLLNVDDLSVRFSLARNSFRAVDQVSFAIAEGETLALVGESGCGKTMTALGILHLVPPRARVEARSITLAGKDLGKLTEKELRGLRGKEVAMIFQEPLSAFNPVYTVGEQIAEGVRVHEQLGRRAAWERAVEVLREVGIPDPRHRAAEYPHQLSGGMRQRAMIAMATACRPLLLMADEPTTALDVSLQAQIIDLLLRLQAEQHLSILLITHDLGVVAELAQQVAVMYAGQIVERAEVKTIFAQPLHPYTRGLLGSIPNPDREPADPSEVRRLTSIEGTVPDLAHLPPGCRFAPRCPHALEPCRQSQELSQPAPGHWVRCCRAKEWLP